MPNLARIVKRTFCHQTVLYWEKKGSNEYGQPTYTDLMNPRVLECRYEERLQEILNWQGRKVISRGYFLLIEKLLPGSLVFPGTLADWQALPTYPDLPTFGQGASEILRTKTTPDLKNKSDIYESYL